MKTISDISIQSLPLSEAAINELTTNGLLTFGSLRLYEQGLGIGAPGTIRREIMDAQMWLRHMEAEGFAQQGEFEDDAIGILKEIETRIALPSSNASGGEMQTGGIYWRLCRLLRYFDARLDHDEGPKQAEFIRATHGQLPQPQLVLGANPADASRSIM